MATPSPRSRRRPDGRTRRHATWPWRRGCGTDRSQVAASSSPRLPSIPSHRTSMSGPSRRRPSPRRPLGRCRTRSLRRSEPRDRSARRGGTTASAGHRRRAGTAARARSSPRCSHRLRSTLEEPHDLSAQPREQARAGRGRRGRPSRPPPASCDPFRRASSSRTAARRSTGSQRWTGRGCDHRRDLVVQRTVLGPEGDGDEGSQRHDIRIVASRDQQ